MTTMIDARKGGRLTPGRKSGSARTKARAAGILLAPALIVLFAVTVVPIFYGFYLSLTDYNPVERAAPTFHGLDGYIRVLGMPAFWSSIGITLTYALGTLAIAVPGSLALAMLVNGTFRGVKLFRTLLYLPRVVSLVAVSTIWLWIYSRDGLLNYVLDVIGLAPISFLTDENTALVSLIVMRAWKALGGSMIIFLAGLQAMPRDLYEAASIDGCGRWASFRHITLPLLVPITTYVVTVDLIYLAQSFSEIYVLTSGGPLGSTTVVNMLIYKEAFEYFRLGEASSMAFILFALIFALSLFSTRVLSRRGVHA
ncbi:ABC-type sugar transport system permease subunit [Agromyces terreus]|uniref:ABC-type sugar transport system permease subunit n=1 Tax=Agromyces terreus TaxID=424795 RepID=A0A9X2GZ50_9MICO|nr:sugar ABC transporter permease [Agromyces terreus]MCP2369648.1 ABC-type sugar transport system permease subunit [Agromyces terreus]